MRLKKTWQNLKMNSWYNAFLEMGKISGCHQMPQRSFFVKGKQFPVCARCTGTFIGYALGGVLYSFIRLPIWLDFLFLIILFMDWFIQKIGFLESNNVRRLITGVFCGFALMQIYISLICLFSQKLTACF